MASKVSKKEQPEDTIVEIVEIEVQPKKHSVQILRKRFVPDFNVYVDDRIGELRYWESTGDITYSFEVGHQHYMDSFVGRAIKVEKKWIPRDKTREWSENLPLATFEEGYFAGEVLTLDEIE